LSAGGLRTVGLYDHTRRPVGADHGAPGAADGGEAQVAVDIIRLIDGGGQTGDGRAGINRRFCVRAHRTSGGVESHADSGFCRDCLAWLRCETDDDPLADQLDPPTRPEVPPAMWGAYVQMLTDAVAL
jgi:hypothetical protein